MNSRTGLMQFSVLAAYGASTRFGFGIEHLDQFFVFVFSIWTMTMARGRIPRHLALTGLAVTASGVGISVMGYYLAAEIIGISVLILFGVFAFRDFRAEPHLDLDDTDDDWKQIVLRNVIWQGPGRLAALDMLALVFFSTRAVPEIVKVAAFSSFFLVDALSFPKRRMPVVGWFLLLDLCISAPLQLEIPPRN